MGQPSVGVPTCLALAASAPWEEPAAQWFIGDISPVGNLLPTVVGTAKLVERARSEGATSVVIDTSGLVDGGVARALKYHKAVVSNVERVVAVQRNRELMSLLDLLDQPCRRVIVCQPALEAKDRSPRERRTYRETCYKAHFESAQPCEFDARCVIARDWAAVTDDARAHVTPDTVVGLLDQYGFCLALGIADVAHHDRIRVYSPWRDPRSVTRIQVGKVRINRAGFAETR
jgi:polynucleotide 5'-kinase involved in rRNA processing